MNTTPLRGSCWLSPGCRQSFQGVKGSELLRAKVCWRMSARRCAHVGLIALLLPAAWGRAVGNTEASQTELRTWCLTSFNHFTLHSFQGWNLITFICSYKHWDSALDTALALAPVLLGSVYAGYGGLGSLLC